MSTLILVALGAWLLGVVFAWRLLRYVKDADPANAQTEPCPPPEPSVSSPSAWIGLETPPPLHVEVWAGNERSVGRGWLATERLIVVVTPDFLGDVTHWQPIENPRPERVCRS